MQRRALGSQGLATTALGLGCMGMSFAYQGADEAECRATIRHAVEQGVAMFDTADMYGPHTNERLVGDTLAPMRDEVVVATKFGNRIDTPERPVDGRPEYVHAACDGSLQRLGTDVIDLYYQHRVDPDVPIEETVGAMGELVAAGKVRFLGLSEAGAETIRRAHATHPISAVQTEYSLWTRDAEAEVLPTLRELGIGLVAYSPLGRGFLTGAIRERDALAEDDGRRNHPRFAAGNLEHNLALLQAVERVAADADASPAQVSLAWVLARGEDIVAIPGTTRRAHLDENLAGAALSLTDDDLAELSRASDTHEVAGERYPPGAMQRVET